MLINDKHRGSTVGFNKHMSIFIPHAHFTPLGIADKHNPYKKSRQIFVALFCVDVDSYCIKDWTNKWNKPEVTFLGSFELPS